MKFNSTRGGVSDVSFSQGIFMGYTNDGGMLMPAYIPDIDFDHISSSWSCLSYVDLAVEILSLFTCDSEISRTELKDIVVKAHGSDFSCPVPQIDDDLHILELFHGKTKAFKDIPLALTAQFLDFFLEKKKKHITLLVGTSGDTGSAAIESVKHSKNIDIIVLFPKGYCTRVQELQMTTVLDQNVHVFAIEGACVDADVPIKACMIDKQFAGEYNLGSVNSVNIARILAQIVFYFHAYFKVCKKLGDIVKIIVPTGALGNVSAGCIAAKMGLPITLISAVNENDSLYKTLTTGVYTHNPTAIKTWSTAMDIQYPYNMERILYLFSNYNTSLVSSLMKTFEEKGSVEIPDDLNKKIGRTLSSDWVCKDEVLATIKTFWETYHYVLCPHTAIAVKVALRDRINMTESKVCVCMATASPAKFMDAVNAAEVDYTPPPEILNLENLPTRYEQMRKDENWEEILREKIITIGN